MAIGRRPLGTDIIPFVQVGVVSDALFELHDQRYGLSLGETIFATVEATNKAGLSSKASSLPVRLLSGTDKNLLTEEDFLCVNV